MPRKSKAVAQAHQVFGPAVRSHSSFALSLHSHRLFATRTTGGAYRSVFFRWVWTYLLGNLVRLIRAGRLARQWTLGAPPYPSLSLISLGAGLRSIWNRLAN